MPPEIACRRVAVEEILPLRHRILRPGLPFETARFDGDQDAATRHYAATSAAEPVVCLSLMPSTWEGRPAWQLRGMATDSGLQGTGLGRRLLEAAVADVRPDEPDRIFWCNARMSAVGFYEKLGWRVVSDVFDVPTVGPHVKMVLEPRACGGTVAHPDRLQAGSQALAARATRRAPARSPVAPFIALELAFLAAAHFLGGPPWVALGVLAVIGQVVADFRLKPLMGLLPAAGWMLAHHLTGNRELFFPYAMALAAHLACQFSRRGRGAATLAAGLVAAAFLVIRILQAATAPVLAVECGVAAAIIAALVTGLPFAKQMPWGTTVLTALASLVAYAGLAL